MKVVYSNEFLKSAKHLPRPIAKKLSELLELLQKDVFHPKLHTKSLVGKLKGFYSFRITRDWRVIFTFLNSKTIFLIDVGHREDIYK